MVRHLSATVLILFTLLVPLLEAQEDSLPPDLTLPVTPEGPKTRRQEVETLLGEILLVQPDLSPEVQEALGILPREKYVPENLTSLAYQNRTVPLGEGLFLPAPSDLGGVIDRLRITLGDRVLVVGAGAGYVADWISLLAAEVVLVEKSNRERERMVDLMASGERSWDRENLTVLRGGALTPLLTEEPFDAVFVHAGVVRIPETLFTLLAPTARMVVPLRGDSGFTLLGFYETSPLGMSLSVHEELFFPQILEW